MRGSLNFLTFVVITIVSWGVCGPLLHIGQKHMGADGSLGCLRPFICVGIAYFLIAVIYPAFVLITKGEEGVWSVGGFCWSFIAGTVGALGALAIILAFKFNGDPVYVMPLVFGCAPVANTIVAMLLVRTIRDASMLFYISVLIVAIGAAGVLIFKPAEPKKSADEDKTAKLTLVSFQDNEKAADETAPAAKTEEPETKDTVPIKQDRSGTSNFFIIAACIAAAALCWGAYGAILQKGQAKMGGSSLRPFLCVGLAYFVVAVILPFVLLPYFPEPGSWSRVGGIIWSLLAGAAAAIGALCIVYAFNVGGGKPAIVMPLVFGVAPIVNTLTETIYKGLYAQIQYTFWISLMLVIFGAVLVLICAPGSKPPPPQSDPPQPNPESAAIDALTGR